MAKAGKHGWDRCFHGTIKREIDADGNPVVLNNDDNKTSTTVVVKPPKSRRKPRNQNEPFGDYSTVTDFARLRG